jgi:7TM diverse intracellular signalling
MDQRKNTKRSTYAKFMKPLVRRTAAALALFGLIACYCGCGIFNETPSTASGPQSFSLHDGWEYALASSRDAAPDGEFRPIPDQDLIHLAGLTPEGVGWVVLRNRFRAPAEFVGADVALLAGRIIWNDVVYLNDNYLGGREQFDESGEQPNHWNRMRLYRIPAGWLNFGERINTLTIRVYVNAEGSLSEIPAIGPVREMQRRDAFQSFFRVDVHVIVAAVLLVFAIYHLFIYFKRRVDRENLYYALFLCGFAVYETNFFLHLIPPLSAVPYLLQQQTIWAVMQLTIYAGVLFVLKFVHESLGRVAHVAIALVLLGPILTLGLFTEYQTFYAYRSYYLITVVLFLIASTTLSVRGMFRRVAGARSLALGMALLLLPTLHDIVTEILKLDVEVFLGAYGFPLFLGSMAFALANKFVNLHNEVESLNVGLERRVSERTQELNESLTRIRELNERQDGDYFLTSLLLRPLGVNYAHSETFVVEFFLRQKKQFRFRQYERDLGGDLCGAHSIHLQGEAFTVFVNADAMGKSMQGAGGALVLGSVFQSIIERTRMSPREQQLSAEAWLKNAFVELHKVF